LNKGKSASTVQIRNASRGDLPTIIALDERITKVPKREYWRELFDHLSERHHRSAILVAETGRRVIGFIIGEVRAWEFGSPPCGWIFALNVDPEFRERGTASALFEAISAYFREQHVGTVRTLLRHDDHLIMSFFRSQGLRAGPFLQLEKDLGA
jgi:ribosomal protein S18 acetylase RimI-like enzyme